MTDVLIRLLGDEHIQLLLVALVNLVTALVNNARIHQVRRELRADRRLR